MCFNLWDNFSVCLCWGWGSGGVITGSEEVRGVCEAQVPNQRGNTWTRAEPPSNSSPIVAAKRRNVIQPEIRRTFRLLGGKVHRARRWGEGEDERGDEREENLENKPVDMWSPEEPDLSQSYQLTAPVPNQVLQNSTCSWSEVPDRISTLYHHNTLQRF